MPTALESEYETVHNVVQLGVDHTGSRPVIDDLAAAIDDDTALYFPRGEYRIEKPLSAQGFRNLALVGNRALVRPADGYAREVFQFGTDAPATDLRFAGIDFDLTAEHTGARPVHAAIRDGLLVGNVTVYGRQDVDQDSMRFDVTDPSGTGRVAGLRMPDGGSAAFPNTGIYVGERSVGTLEFRDCHVAGFPDNGLYASPARGTVVVNGGRYANNGIASVRVSGSSRIDGVHVVCDSTRRGLENMRGIRLREGRDIRVQNTRVEMLSVTESDAGITMAEWLETATIANSTVVVDADRVPGIIAKEPTRKRSRPETRGVTIEDVTITGTAADESAIAVNDRDGCEFARLCIHHQGRDRDGVVLRNSGGAVFAETTIDVTGEPLVLDNSSANRRHVRFDRLDSC